MLTARAWGQDQPEGVPPIEPEVPAVEQISLGMIGPGKRGHTLMRNFFLKDPQFRLLAVAEVDTTRRNQAVDLVNRAYGNTDCQGFVDYRDLLEREDVDAVVIVTPDHWHTLQTIHAAQAGKDIYCEKPLTHNLHEGKLIIDAVNKHGRILQTGSQQRSEYGHHFARAAEYVRSGRLGKITQVHVNVREAPIWCDLPDQSTPEGMDWDRWIGPAPMRAYHQSLAPEGIPRSWPRWRAYREYCGGYLADMGAHQFDIAQWALGKDHTTPVRIVPPAEEDATRGTELYYADGTKLIHGGGETGAGGLTIVGENGTIVVHRGGIKSEPGNILEQPLAETDVHLPRPVSHAANWADAIRSREKSICPVEIGAHTAAICQMTNISYWVREELNWDPVKWEFTNSQAANALRGREYRDGFELPNI
ncbi:MAG: Gfo/Idh/MocA family oxidoreductase [Planctomycetota bacterium]